MGLKFKTWLAATALTVTAAQAFAAVERYAFTATINALWEYDKASGVITNVNSSTFAGAPVSMADAVQGTMSFNTDAPLNPYQPEPPASGSYVIYQLDSAVSGITTMRARASKILRR